uniref:Uncharacterized protein n=1 Tax=viral metagenome TaxID=1070528 RepID=A0A6H2A1N6_9ZZZZ
MGVDPTELTWKELVEGAKYGILCVLAMCGIISLALLAWVSGG